MAFATEAQAKIIALALYPNDGFLYNALIVWAPKNLKMSIARNAVGLAMKSELHALEFLIAKTNFYIKYGPRKC